MLLIDLEVEVESVILLQCICDGVQTAVSGSHDFLRFPLVLRGDRGDDSVVLLEVHLRNAVRTVDVFEAVDEQLEDLVRCKLSVFVVGFGLDRVADSLAHKLRQPEPEVMFQDKCDSALSGLAVDADHVSVIVAADVGRINRNIRHGPGIESVLRVILHPLRDRILMGSGEGCKYKRAAVRASRIEIHTGIFLILVDDIEHVIEVQLRINALAVHIQGKGDNVNVSGTLTVSEDRSFDPVRPGQDSHLRVGNAGSTVIVRMQGQHHIVPVLQIVRHILNLVRIDMRHGKLYGRRQVDDRLPVRFRLPHIKNRIADLQRKLRLRSGK